MRILQLGGLLGAVAYLALGREFRNDELGVLVWPLTTFYLLSFFYVLTFLVFTSVKSWLRYVVIPLWLLMMLLMAAGLTSLAFTDRERDDGFPKTAPSWFSVMETRQPTAFTCGRL